MKPREGGRGEDEAWGTPQFRLLSDRREAGKLLASRLRAYRDQQAIVLALPRGGVPVAREIARELSAELDVLVARKLGAPGQEELAIGAVTADGTRYLNEELLQMLRVPADYVMQVTEQQQEVARRRQLRLRDDLAPLQVAGRLVILVDDGLATGATMRAAVWSLRRQHPGKLVVAVPVGAAESCASLEPEVDELVCLLRAQPFHSVGMYYRDFEQVSDEEVVELLREQPASPPYARPPGSSEPRHGGLR